MKMVDDERLEDEIRNLNTMPIYLHAFILPNSQKIMNNFKYNINGFCSKGSYHGDS